MESFDASLKYLLQEEPEDFIRFGFADPQLAILGPCETDLPSRSRAIDGSYIVVRNGVRMVAHIEFHRRHQSVEELAVDVAEAQIRLYRRESCPVVSHVWDLYGERNGSLLTPRKLEVGPGTQSTYVRVNLRAMKWQQLLHDAPPALWPLVPLTQEGGTEIAVKSARDAIVAGGEHDSSHVADHLAVLWFVAEAEDVPTEIIKSYIKRAKLMGSALYKSIFAEGEQHGLSQGLSQGLLQGTAQGAAQAYAATISKLISRRLGSIEPNVYRRLAAWPNRETLEAWHDEALDLNDAESARKLLEKIQNTPMPSPANDS